MGLTIHYSLNAGTRPLSAIRKTLAALRDRALALPFRSVGPIVEFVGDDCAFSDENEPYAWLKVQAMGAPRPGPIRRAATAAIYPRRIVAFSIDPAQGSEPANIGFCAYPCTPRARGGRWRQRRTAWSWSAFCKTQYASNPTLGGMENFLQAHLGIVRLLDYAQEIGILANVQDEGRYWERRSVEDLLREVGEWNKMIAAGYGVMRDAIESTGGNPNSFQAEITRFCDFERLEAKGHLR